VYGKFIPEATSIKEEYENGDILGSQPHVDEMFSNPDELIILTKEKFIEKCKINEGFSESWGLKIQKRELSFEEKIKWVMKYTDAELENLAITERVFDSSTPTKLITLTHNNETAEFYE
jgi:hypothetical protein